jgi:hypothetical protein
MQPCSDVAIRLFFGERRIVNDMLVNMRDLTLKLTGVEGVRLSVLFGIFF